MQVGVFRISDAPTLYPTPISGALNDCLATVQSLRVLAGIENSFWKVTGWIREIGREITYKIFQMIGRQQFNPRVWNGA